MHLVAPTLVSVLMQMALAHMPARSEVGEISDGYARALASQTEPVRFVLRGGYRDRIEP